jgi:cbb3-type cytochrome oxidase subunit 1
MVVRPQCRGVLLTAGFLGMMYYFLPVRAGRPLFSYRLSIISFWGITFFYMWAGSHHLHYRRCRNGCRRSA